MKYLIIILCAITFISCIDNRKSTKTDKLIAELESEINSDISDADIDKLGNFKFDMGSASAGRVAGKLSEVFITMEILPERPGCADICPEMAVIHFKCEKDAKCVTDPAFVKDGGYFTGGAITFVDLEKGKEVYDLLNKIKNNL